MFFLFSKDRFKRCQWCPWCPSHIYKTPPLCSYPITHICHTTPLLLPSTVPFHCFSSVSPLFLLCFSSIYPPCHRATISPLFLPYSLHFFHLRRYFVRRKILQFLLFLHKTLFLHYFSTISPLFLHYLSTVSPLFIHCFSCPSFYHY